MLRILSSPATLGAVRNLSNPLLSNIVRPRTQVIQTRTFAGFFDTITDTLTARKDAKVDEEFRIQVRLGSSRSLAV